MQRQPQPSSSPSSEDAKEERWYGIENWIVIAFGIEHLAVVGGGGYGVEHQLSSHAAVSML
jgi:hypothetical protein